MKKIRYLLLWLLLPAAMLVKLGCVDVPKDLVMPKWDVDLTVPIKSSTYTLMDAVKKDTSKLKYYRDQTNYGLLYYSDARRINSVTVGDNLNVSSFSTGASVAIGSIQISSPQPVNLTVYPSDLGLPDGTYPFHSISNQSISKSFEISQEFSSVTVNTGTLDLKVANSFPVAIVLNRIVIKNQDNSILIDDQPQYSIPSPGSKDFLYSINGKTVSGTLKIELTMSSPGSGSNPVVINSGTNLAFSAQVQNFTFSKVTAKINQNSFNINDSFVFDDSTFVQSAVIDRGSLSITANNNIDLDLTATLTVPSLKTPSGAPFTQVINLARKEQNKVIQLQNLSGYTLADPSGALTNSIQYSISVSTSGSTDFRTINSTDNVSASINISNLYFRSFTGKIKPTALTINDTSIDLNLGEIEDKLLVNQIDFENPSISLRLSKSTNVPVSFSGQLTGKSSTTTAQLNIPVSTLGAGETVITLNSSQVRNFIKSFSGKLPTTILVKGQGVVNPTYTTATIASADSVYGTAQIEFPMKVSITGGSIKDSSNVDLSDNDRTEMKKVNGGSLVLEIQNGIAFDASVSARLYDASNNFLTNLPPAHAPNNTLIHVQAATVNAQGQVTAPAVTKITFAINKDDVDRISQSSYIKTEVSFYTAGNNGVPVAFKTSDAITIKAYGTLNYTVEEKK